MIYRITWIRDRQRYEHTGTRAQVQALADYLARTFRLRPDVSLIGAPRWPRSA